MSGLVNIARDRDPMQAYERFKCSEEFRPLNFQPAKMMHVNARRLAGYQPINGR